MAMPKKRHQSPEDPYSHPVEPKKGKLVHEQAYASPPPPIMPRVFLNPADCDLDFNFQGDGRIGSALYEEEFAYCWSGARANIGIVDGKYYFGCRIITNQPVNMDDTPPYRHNLCRVGVSLGDDPVGNLGETSHSFAFEGTGKFFTPGRFLDYREGFEAGDTIICYVDLDGKPSLIGFSKNGKWLGIESQFDGGRFGLGVVDYFPSKRPPWRKALFPHVLLKNVVVQMQFSAQDGLTPQEGYKPWASAIEDGKGILGPTFQCVKDCEAIMMVGLPASGKSTWAENLVKNYPEKRYVLLGTNLALDQMKVPGILRKCYYTERFGCLMNQATKILNTLVSRASKVPRNFIIDQANVNKSVRRIKLKLFADYNKIAVVVFPGLSELKKRARKRFWETGKQVSAKTVNEILVKYTLPMTKDMPNTDEYFDKVCFPEFSRDDAQIHLDKMKKELTLYQEVYTTPEKGSVQFSVSKTSSKTYMPPHESHLQHYQFRSHETSSVTSYGAHQQNYQASSHETSIIPSYGAQLQNYRVNDDEMSINLIPSPGVPPHTQGSLHGHLGFGDGVNSYSVQTPSEAPPQDLYASQPQGHPPYGTPFPSPPFGSFPP